GILVEAFVPRKARYHTQLPAEPRVTAPRCADGEKTAAGSPKAVGAAGSRP
ncbi:hypothetical protein I3W98_19905, partial [Streptomyces cavourensis]|nr:hypothetical protein [Streptomyces cavourensis]